FFSSRRRHTRFSRDWSSDVCSSDLLIQALQWMPGVRKSGEITGGLLVRGGEPDQNLYLLEDAPIYHPWHAFSLISTFQTETFKRSEERRVGKEYRVRRSQEQQKQKD